MKPARVKQDTPSSCSLAVATTFATHPVVAFPGQMLPSSFPPTDCWHAYSSLCTPFVRRGQMGCPPWTMPSMRRLHFKSCMALLVMPNHKNSLSLLLFFCRHVRRDVSRCSSKASEHPSTPTISSSRRGRGVHIGTAKSARQPEQCPSHGSESKRCDWEQQSHCLLGWGCHQQ